MVWIFIVFFFYDFNVVILNCTVECVFILFYILLYRLHIETFILLKVKIMRTYSCLQLVIWTCIFHMVDNSTLQGKDSSHFLRRIVNLKKDEGKMLHRAKRGWMWNQFFLLEEYTGTDTQYVGKVRIFLWEIQKLKDYLLSLITTLSLIVF